MFTKLSGVFYLRDLCEKNLSHYAPFFFDKFNCLTKMLGENCVNLLQHLFLRWHDQMCQPSIKDIDDKIVSSHPPSYICPKVDAQSIFSSHPTMRSSPLAATVFHLHRMRSNLSFQVNYFHQDTVNLISDVFIFTNYKFYELRSIFYCL